MVSTDRAKQIRKLQKRRQMLRKKLQEHFSLSVLDRNYEDFEKIVDELDVLRKMMGSLRGRRADGDN